MTPSASGMCRIQGVVWSLALILVSACSTPSVGPVAGPAALDEVEPIGPEAREYGGQSESRRMTAVREALSRHIAIPADSRLDSVAEDLALLSDQTDGYPPGTLDFLLQHYGVAEPAPASITLKSSAGDEEALAKVVANALHQSISRRKPKRYGVAAHATRSGWTVVFVTQESGLDLRRVPRLVGPRDVVDIRGTLPRGFRNAALYRTDPRGVVDEPVVVAQGRGFHGAVACKRGVNQVEVVAEGAFGATVLANFPSYCGVDAPMAMAVESEEGFDDDSASDLARRLFNLANRERELAGLPNLEWSL